MITNIPKVAILVSHPTQFEAPLYKFITESGLVDLRVYFWTTSNTSKLIDPELGHPPGWDFPLTEGYEWDLLPQKPRNLWKFIKQNIFQHGRFDAILISGWGHPVARLSLLCGILSRAPLVVVTDATRLYPCPLYKRLMRSGVFRIVFRLIPAFMVKGSLSKNYLRYYGVPEEKIFLFPYTVDNEMLAAKCNFYKQQKYTLRAKLGIVENTIVVLAVAKFVPREGVITLLEAYAQLQKNYRHTALVLVGDGPQKEMLQSFAQKNCSEKQVIFVGYQPYSYLPKYYALADVFVHPAIQEPWGVSVNEAMACGLPVIVSDRVGAAYDLVQDGENGFIFRGGDVRSLQTVLERFFSIPENERLKMGAKSQDIIRTWSYRTNLQGLLAVVNYLKNKQRIVRHRQ